MNENETPENESPAEPDAPAPANDAAPDADPGAAVAGADDRTAELEAQVAELRDQLLRAMAETENMRKRSERHVQDAHKFAVTGFARDILQVADNLERALDAVPEERRDEHELLGVLAEGVKAVQASFFQVMEANHIKRLDPMGEAFDPNMHEAMFEVPGTDLPNGTVAQVIQPGYQLHDRLLRPARVGVAKSAGGESGADDGKVDTTA
ncbi:MAG: nucleotide exchange factor GrpE [Alphaproteobacteria bacterium]|nr:nucleotide exchange factor GrpE [Alphaproteobacteria bacterium]